MVRLLLAGILVVLTQVAPAQVSALWSRADALLGPGAPDEPAKVLVDASGNVILTGSSNDRRHSYDFVVCKYSGATGALVWEARWDGALHGDDFARAVALDAAGNVIVAGTTSAGGAATYAAAVKFAGTDGAVLWQQISDGGSEGFQAVAIDAAGNAVLAGSAPSGAYDRAFLVMKCAAADGAILWQRSTDLPGHTGEEARAIIVDARAM